MLKHLWPPPDLFCCSGGSATRVCLQPWVCRSLEPDTGSSSCTYLIIHLRNIERGEGHGLTLIVKVLLFSDSTESCLQGD